MVILAYNLKQPTTGDRGSIFYPALEEAIQRLSSHNHDGNNSALISASSTQAAYVDALSANWLVTSPGRWYQDISLPAGYTYDNSIFEVRTIVGGVYVKIYTGVARISNTVLRVATNDNTVDFRIYIK